MPFKPLIVLRPDRVCHVCQLGSRLDDRVIGAQVIYVGLEDDVVVQLADERRVGRAVAIEPYRRHRIAAGRQHVCTLLIEPESVTDEDLHDLRLRLDHAPGDTGPFADLFDFLAGLPNDPARLDKAFEGLSFDRLAFRRDLEPRPLDRRIDRIAELIEQDLGAPLDSESCAREIALTASRFRRLFRESTGVQFRNYRMWKRARTYLRYVNAPTSLTQTALELGYPDSTHFSHSIRQTYGLPPRQMKTHMKHSLFFFGSEPVQKGPGRARWSRSVATERPSASG